MTALFSNALLYYTYLPLVVSTITLDNKKAPISIASALHMIIITFKMVTSGPLLNAVTLSLMSEQLPKSFLDNIEKETNNDPIGFRNRWIYRLPAHYSFY